MITDLAAQSAREGWLDRLQAFIKSVQVYPDAELRPVFLEQTTRVCWVGLVAHLMFLPMDLRYLSTGWGWLWGIRFAQVLMLVSLMWAASARLGTRAYTRTALVVGASSLIAVAVIAGARGASTPYQHAMSIAALCVIAGIPWRVGSVALMAIVGVLGYWLFVWDPALAQTDGQMFWDGVASGAGWLSVLLGVIVVWALGWRARIADYRLRQALESSLLGRVDVIKRSLEQLAVSDAPDANLAAECPGLVLAWGELKDRLESAERALRQGLLDQGAGRQTRKVIHDLKPVLGAVRLLAQGEGYEAPQARALLTSVAQRLNDAVSRLASENAASVGDPTDVTRCSAAASWCEVIERARAIVANAAATQKQDHTVSFVLELDPALAALLVPGDPVVAQRAIENLLVNAVEAYAKRIEVSLSREADGRVALEVSDDGVGISDAALRTFGQAGATHGKAGGSGLGLSSVREWARGLGGDVLARRGDGGGTRILCRALSY